MDLVVWNKRLDWIGLNALLHYLVKATLTINVFSKYNNFKLVFWNSFILHTLKGYDSCMLLAEFSGKMIRTTGQRGTWHISNIVANDSTVISWSDTIRYLAVNIVAGHKFTCSLDTARGLSIGNIMPFWQGRSDCLRRRYNWTVES